MKRGFLTTILLGFVLFSGIVIFVATLGDEMVVKNKLINLKTITDNTVLALAKHYVANENIEDAQEVATNLLLQTELGAEVSDSITYTWDLVSSPKTVTANIDSYSQSTFWYKMLDKESFELQNIKSMAEIIEVDPISTQTSALAPIAINNCDRDSDEIEENDIFLYNEIDFTFVTAPLFNNFDNDTFYAIDKDCSFPTGNSNFAHFKNLFTGGEVEYADYDIADEEEACLVQTSFQNPLTVDPLQLYNQLKHFTLPYPMTIPMFECGTTAEELNISELLSVELVQVNSLVKETNEDGDKVNNLTVRFKVVPSSQTVILKY